MVCGRQSVGERAVRRNSTRVAISLKDGPDIKPAFRATPSGRQRQDAPQWVERQREIEIRGSFFRCKRGREDCDKRPLTCLRIRMNMNDPTLAPIGAQRAEFV